MLPEFQVTVIWPLDTLPVATEYAIDAVPEHSGSFDAQNREYSFGMTSGMRPLLTVTVHHHECSPSRVRSDIAASRSGLSGVGMWR